MVSSRNDLSLSKELGLLMMFLMCVLGAVWMVFYVNYKVGQMNHNFDVKLEKDLEDERNKNQL